LPRSAMTSNACATEGALASATERCMRAAAHATASLRAARAPLTHCVAQVQVEHVAAAERRRGQRRSSRRRERMRTHQHHMLLDAWLPGSADGGPALVSTRKLGHNIHNARTHRRTGKSR
jgi:hypothetical protein